MSTEPTKPTSLRALARELGVHHSSLSAAIHGGRLTRGVRIDDDGRVIVTDASAATAQWRAVHVSTMGSIRRWERDDRLRRHERRVEAAQAAEFAMRSTATVLVTLHLIWKDDREAAIADLRDRFVSEAVAFTVDDDAERWLSYFDQAVEEACEWLDEQETDEDDDA